MVSLRERGSYQGKLGASIGAATVTGPLLGGVFSDRWTWRWAFYINLPFGALCILILILYCNIPSPKQAIGQKLTRIDWLGSFIIVASTCLILIGLNWGGDAYPWNSLQVLVTLSLGAFLMVVFVLVETFVAVEPIVPVSAIFYIPLEFQVVHGHSAFNAGVRMIPLQVSLVIGSVVAGSISTRTGRFVIFCQVGPFLAALGSGLFALWDESSASFWQEIVFQLIAGFGTGLVMQTVVMAVQASVHPDNLATATAATNFFRSIGGVVGVSPMNSILNNRWLSELQPLLPPGVVVSPSDKVDIQEIKTYPDTLREAFIVSFLKSIKLVWYATSAL
ncbi:hypothetical protein HDU76_001716 [Blyttiomyces sp. JEL0837]|nr:hypothetical protein HDU76_001716 [Blyttiomyces sp. JEL0837]